MKDFDSWNVRKKQINDRIVLPEYIVEGEIWWCVLGVNVGSEQDGSEDTYERPVLVIKRFTKKLYLVIPLTSQKKIGTYYPKLTSRSYLLFLQIRVVDAKRMQRKLRTVTPRQFAKVRNLFKRLL